MSSTTTMKLRSTTARKARAAPGTSTKPETKKKLDATKTLGSSSKSKISDPKKKQLSTPKKGNISKKNTDSDSVINRNEVKTPGKTVKATVTKTPARAKSFTKRDSNISETKKPAGRTVAKRKINEKLTKTSATSGKVSQVKEPRKITRSKNIMNSNASKANPRKSNCATCPFDDTDSDFEDDSYGYCEGGACYLQSNRRC